MIWVGRLFRFLAGMAARAIAVPWLLFQLAVLLLLASGAAIVTFMLIRGLILGEAVVTDPTSVVGRLGFLFVQLAFWALAVRFWAYLHGFDHLLARRGNSHGSARFSSKAERAAFRQGDGLLIGRDADTGRLLRYDGPAHLLTLAPTRAGKGVGTIIPNLLTANRPVLVIDPKGENARIAAKAREHFGPVHVLDPFGVTGLPSAACNPMARLDPGDPDLDTAKWLSESIGKETAYGQSESHQPGDPASLTTAPLARDLLTPDEIMQMPAHLQLLRVQDQPVMLAEKLRYYADPEFRELFTPQLA